MLIFPAIQQYDGLRLKSPAQAILVEYQGESDA
jgi:hypothetical protein